MKKIKNIIIKEYIIFFFIYYRESNIKIVKNTIKIRQKVKNAKKVEKILKKC